MNSPKMSDILKDYVENTVKNIVTQPDSVEVNVVVSTKTVSIHIKVEKDDCGLVIGKRGRIIDALKTLVSAIKSIKYPLDTRNVSLEVLEDENSSFGSRYK